MKGQGAAEYLILLAIVLIISLVGLMLIGGFSDSSTTAMENEAKIYWSSARPFAILEWVQSNSTLYLKVKNGDSKRLILRSIKVDNTTAQLGSGWVFGPGAEKTVSISGLTNCSATYDYFSYEITFNYDSADISNLSQKGVKPIAGRCLYN
ncbi:MAG: hypothetical protein N3D10_01835 [Candidatus Micrarchaeota archaeon]|nr:hypothetical protein [Candidatus Micrarchaeota archaeon]